MSIFTSTAWVISCCTPVHFGQDPLSEHLVAVKIQSKESNLPLCQGYLLILLRHFRVVFKYGPTPLIYKRRSLIGGSHPCLPKRVNNGVTDWSIFINIISGIAILSLPF